MRLKTLLITLFSILFLAGCSYKGGFITADFLPEDSWIRLSTYGLMMACGFLTANFLLQKEFHRLGMRVAMADTIIIILVLGGIAGAKLFFVWETSDHWYGVSGFFSQLFSLGGLTWYGGVVVAGVAMLVYLRYVKISYARMGDIGTPALAIGYMFGRLGCLFSGDGCYGMACDLGWPAPFAMAFPNGAAHDTWSELVRDHGPDVVVYNTPFYEATFSLLLFAFFFFKRTREWPLGVKFVTFIILHSLFRFLVEFIRLNPPVTLPFGEVPITQGQFISLAFIAVSIFYLVKQRGEIMKWIKGAEPYGTGNK